MTSDQGCYSVVVMTTQMAAAVSWLYVVQYATVNI